MGEAFLWGTVTGSSLVIGGILALRAPITRRHVGLIMAFGARVLLSAVAYELVQEAFETSAGEGGIALGLLAGSLVFFLAEILIDRLGKRRSAKLGEDASAPTAAVGRALVPARCSGNEPGAARAAPESNPLRRGLAERRLELTAGGELGHGGRRDLHALAGARVDALTRGALLCGELSETGERHRVAALERLGHGVEERVDRRCCIPLGKAALVGHLVDELGLRHCPLLPSFYAD